MPITSNGTGLGTGIFPVGATSIFEATAVKGEGLNVDPIASVTAAARSQLPGIDQVGDWLKRNQGTVLLAIGGIVLLVVMRK